MSRQELANIYLDWKNNFVSIQGFAEHYGLYVHEAEILLDLARECFNTKHPDQ